ncbi:MAG: LicD family protein [Chlamydiia bacterium]|nr:LicD family protein [Chlamydiia bacterium]
MLELWDAFTAWTMHAGMPLVMSYHAVTGSVFLNTEIEGDRGLEYVSNQVLIPVHYLLAGNKAVYDSETGQYCISQRFDYREKHFGYRSVASMCALPASLVLGTTLKAVAFLNRDVRERYAKVSHSLKQIQIKPQLDYYTKLGMQVDGHLDELKSVVYQREPGAEIHLKEDKEALANITTLLKKHNIPHWLDCGTCLGAYRYRGIIPWDKDIDIAVLQSDFDNVKNALKELNPDKYVVCDWSSRDKEKSYLMLWMKESGRALDIYCFGVDEEKSELNAIVSNVDCHLLPESWKVRERRFMRSMPYDQVFPLKKTLFDGLEVYVPNRTEAYLQQIYGKDLRPAKIYNAQTGAYEKDLTHPYWQRAHAH